MTKVKICVFSNSVEKKKRKFCDVEIPNIFQNKRTFGEEACRRGNSGRAAKELSALLKVGKRFSWEWRPV